MHVFHWHGETFDIPTGAAHVARSAACENQAFVYGDRVVALQFHLETTPDSSRQLMRNCANELVEGDFIQTPTDMVADPSRFAAINVRMADLLDRLMAELQS